VNEFTTGQPPKVRSRHGVYTRPLGNRQPKINNDPDQVREPVVMLGLAQYSRTVGHMYHACMANQGHHE
jgi:hypothetical protein